MSMHGGIFDQFSLQGKVAIVTGGSRGIGRSISLGFAHAGADIALISRKQKDLEQVGNEISSMGRRALPISANLRKISEIESLVQQVVEKMGKIDVLVNNAGTNLGYNSVFEIDEPYWDIVMDLNLKACFFLSKAVGNIMRRNEGGCIINVASRAAISPNVGLGVYSISKAALVMMTKVLSQELGRHKIRVNTLSPGTIKTKFSEGQWKSPEKSEQIKMDRALGRIGYPEEMTGAALFLASKASSYMTGQDIVLDGGFFPSVGLQIKKLNSD